jgi:hypothetical protein
VVEVENKSCTLTLLKTTPISCEIEIDDGLKMKLVVFYLLGCFTPFPIGQEERFSENPDHDYDGDFMTEAQGDCNDLDPNIQNGPWYFDGDGFGDLDNLTSDCDNRDGFVTNPLDCNDNVECNDYSICLVRTDL